VKLEQSMSLKTTFALAALLPALALSACGSGDGAGNPESKLSAKEATTPLEGAPPELTAIRDEANQVLDEGTEGYEERIAELKAAGTPVVVNKWASWCGPCRLEFPHFQAQAQKLGKEVAFLGVGSNDSVDALETFLEQLPLPYPSYYDPDSKIAAEIDAPKNFPATAFYDSKGELVFTHTGPYTDETDLAADIEQYAR